MAKRPLLPDVISIKGARSHNLKNISLDIPKNALVVITGLSGSGKSSLAFDTVYAEGQRRYAESLSSYARQFLEMQDKPDVDEITGLSPTIAIDQKTNSQNPRSTVGTVTEIYDHLRLLFARIGCPHCIICGSEVSQYTTGKIVELIRDANRNGNVIRILAPLLKKQFESAKKFRQLVMRVPGESFRLDGEYVTKQELLKLLLDETQPHTLEVVIADVEKGKQGDVLASVEQALEWGNGIITLHNLDKDLNSLVSTSLMCSVCGTRMLPLEPRLFSFNSPHGACTRCTGLGITLEVDPDLVIPNKKLSLSQGAIEPWVRITGNQQHYTKLLEAVAAKYKFSLDIPVLELSRKAYDILMYGTGDQEYQVGKETVVFDGVIPNLQKRHAETNSDYIRKELESYMKEMQCPTCKGKRLKPDALSVTIEDLSITDVSSLSLDECVTWLLGIVDEDVISITKPPSLVKPKGTVHAPLFPIARAIIKEMVLKLSKLQDVGLSYLTLDRSMTTLSGGEAQRTRLATQLSTGLTSVIYILDEPSIGMHPHDITKLTKTLASLRDYGNSVIVVEHDSEIMRAADYIIDVGPGAGVYGGEIIAQGTYAELLKDKKSTTGQYLSRAKKISIPSKRRKGNNTAIEVFGASAHNLKNVHLKIPLRELVCVTGVSGSGKSTLVLDTLGAHLSKHFYGAKQEPLAYEKITGVEHIDKVISIDQSPIGRTPRSNPATYTGVFTLIRDLFTEVPESKARGYDAGKFSFNVRGGGRCEACAGEGYVRIPMQFLTDVFVECDECHGQRYNREALEIHYREKNIAQILNMTVEEAKFFFNDQPSIYDKLSILSEVGLGYVTLGQSATTLSGGEAQRVKLATELSRRATGRTLYILDEPTTGLHFEDVARLLQVIQTLVDKGNTVLVIEHNLDVIANADYVIDMGPTGGKHGGMIVAEGTPEEIVATGKGNTAAYLAPLLQVVVAASKKKK